MSVSVLARGETFHLASLLPGSGYSAGYRGGMLTTRTAKRRRVLGLPHHHVDNARHFYAIRAVRAGTPYELVARQLGHADIAIVAKVYGRFAPPSDERDRWERIAAAQGAKSTPMGTVGGWWRALKTRKRASLTAHTLP